ncbi:hypothetical protein M3J09_006476 [Ascochyta lentis]
MGDYHQLLPPVWWRGWRQHQKKASCVVSFTNSCLCCYLLGWRRRTYEGAWYNDYGLMRKIMFLCLRSG